MAGIAILAAVFRNLGFVSGTARAAGVSWNTTTLSLAADFWLVQFYTFQHVWYLYMMTTNRDI